MRSKHTLHIGDARRMSAVKAAAVHLVVTPPLPDD